MEVERRGGKIGVNREMVIAEFLLTLRIASAQVVELIVKAGAETEREGRTEPLKEFGC